MTALFAFADWNEDDHTAVPGSDDDDESEEEMDAADVQAPKSGESHLTPEARVFQAVSGMLFNAQADVVEEQLHRKGPTADRLLRHVNTLFQGNTEEGSRMKLGDWTLYCNIVHGGLLPEIQDIQWPPTCDDWKFFLVNARERTASYKRFQGMVGNVCEVAVRYWYKLKGVAKETLDPRIMYGAEHHRVMHTIKREHGMGLKQIAPITMHEARNGTHFADHDSVRGVAACAAFCFGTLLGGRRPRTLTAILLEDLELTVDVVLLQQTEVLVPCMRVRFRQEKYDCKQGPREVTDEPHYTSKGTDYATTLWMSSAFWVYRLLVFRGCFQVLDPLKSAKEGDVLHFRPECIKFFLFCDCQPNYWIDTLPVSVGTLANWNKHLLRKMGTQPRGFSAHRSGFVSRTCILAIFENRGKQLPLGTLEMVTSWGGWQVITGTKTVMEIYARKIVDNFLDPYSLINGFEASEAHWDRKLQQYLGPPVFPVEAVLDVGRTPEHMQVRVHAWRGEHWHRFQTGLNAVCHQIMQAACCDEGIMPLHRFVQGRRAFCLYCAKYADSTLVVAHKQMMHARVVLWKTCVKQSVNLAKASFFASSAVSRPERHMAHNAFLQYMRPVIIGNVGFDGSTNCHKLPVADWDKQGMFFWL